MSASWRSLTAMTNGAPFVVERIRVVKTGIAVEGEFELPPLFHLSADDQEFLIEFVRAHGSIKAMEGVFGVSYPTIKARLNRVVNSLNGIVAADPTDAPRTAEQREVIERLERGEISASEALAILKTKERAELQ